MLPSGWTFQEHLAFLNSEYLRVKGELQAHSGGHVQFSESEKTNSEGPAARLAGAAAAAAAEFAALHRIEVEKCGDGSPLSKVSLPGQCDRDGDDSDLPPRMASTGGEIGGNDSIRTLRPSEVIPATPRSPVSGGLRRPAPMLALPGHDASGDAGGVPGSPRFSLAGAWTSQQQACGWTSQHQAGAFPSQMQASQMQASQMQADTRVPQLHPEWFEALEGSAPGPLGNSTRRSTNPVSNTSEKVLRSGDALFGKGIFKRLMVPPSSARKITWDLLSFVMIGYDVLLIPMTAFNIPEDVYLTSMDLVVTIFWSCDIILTFLVGFYDKGILEMRPWPVAKRYLRSWFATDLLVVSTDWLVVGLEDSASSTEGSVLGIVRMGKSVRILRVLRMFRLLRILKVISMLEELSDMFHSESIHTGLNIVKLVMAIAVVNHFIACGWYAVGTVDFEQGTWVDHLMERSRGHSVTLGYRYTTSLHWSLTQFTPASMEVTPKNTVERIYAIGIILIALVMFSSFISSITSSMTHLRVLREKQAQQVEFVRKYISDNKLSMDLSNRIQAFIRQNNKAGRSRVHEQDIPVFKFLPENLSLQMHCEVYLPTLCRHPLFAALNLEDPVGLAKICHVAALERSLIPGEELFACGQKASQMYFLVGGVLEYHDGAGENPPQEVVEGRRICEIVLWATWEHQGRLTGVSQAELICIDSSKFRTIARRRGTTSQQIADYAVEYVRRFTEDCSGGAHCLSDIWDDTPHLDEMVTHAFPNAFDVEPFANVLPYGLGRHRWGKRTMTIGGGFRSAHHD